MIRACDPTGLPKLSFRGVAHFNLDKWFQERLPIIDLHGFLSECLPIDPNRFRLPSSSFDEVFFIHALQSAFYGDNEPLSCFINEADLFLSLTEPKREVLAAILKNPQKPYMPRLRKRMLLDSLASTAANLQGWCGYSKTRAVKAAIENHLKGRLVAKGITLCDREGVILCDSETYEKHLKNSESLKTRVFGAIGKEGESYELYCAVLDEKRLERLKLILGW